MCQPRIIATASPAQFQQAIEQAADLLRRGEIVALPTETVYGLAADAMNSEAIGKIYLAKGRPSNNPLIVHVDGPEMARCECASQWTEEAEILTRTFWPGPLSLILKKSKRIPAVTTGGGGTVAIRCPAHPIFQAVIRACGFPLAAPSANRSNHISPTTAEHVRLSLGDHVPLILDGGPCRVGIESTVLDISTPGFPQILRPGMISETAISNALSTQCRTARPGNATSANTALSSPGQFPRHYSPQRPLHLLTVSTEDELWAAAREHSLDPAHCAVILMDIKLQTPVALQLTLPSAPGDYARELYSALYRCDQESPDAILLQLPPDKPEWSPIHDRLRRAGKRFPQ